MNTNVQQILRGYKSSDARGRGGDKRARVVDGPCLGRYNHIGHNLIEMEMEFEVHAIGAARNWEADVGWGGGPGGCSQPCCRPRQSSGLPAAQSAERVAGWTS